MDQDALQVVLERERQFLLENFPEVDFGVGIGDPGEIAIKIWSPAPLSGDDEAMIRKRFGPGVPVWFGLSSLDKRAY